MKQAAGREAATANSEWYEGPVRDFFRDILNANQEYSAAIHSLDRSSVGKLYTPESYATRSDMQSTVSQLHALLDVDKKYESFDEIIKKLEVNMPAVPYTSFLPVSSCVSDRGNLSTWMDSSIVLPCSYRSGRGP